MTCPICEERTKVVDTVHCPDRDYRKHKCPACGYTFFTEELEVIEDLKFKLNWIEHARHSYHKRNHEKEKM